jgi:hypothetical protein
MVFSNVPKDFGRFVVIGSAKFFPKAFAFFRRKKLRKEAGFSFLNPKKKRKKTRFLEKKIFSIFFFLQIF